MTNVEVVLESLPKVFGFHQLAKGLCQGSMLALSSLSPFSTHRFDAPFSTIPGKIPLVTSNGDGHIHAILRQ